MAVRHGAGEWTLETAHGQVHLAGVAHGADKVIGLARHLLALRAAGTILPSATPVPIQALSRLGAPEAANERGLSLSAEEPR